MARTSKYQVLNTASQNTTMWNAGLYVRLSREDGDKIESESVNSQRAIIEDFLLSRSDINIADYYIDDGWSGTDFERPGFQRMMEDIRNKKVNCVIVKDLSRFGRNYVEAGKYLEVVFPMFKIRFIAINDNIDSIDNPSSMNTVMVPFKNIMNDEYCRDISTKVRSALDARRRQGKFIGSFALYGYKKDENDHHKLVIDEPAAEVVREIYNKFLSGYSIIGTARYLNDSGILCPSEYKRKQGMKYNHPQLRENVGMWQDRTVRRILTNEMYIGNMVQKRNEIISYKVHLAQAVARDRWIVIQNTHDGIISKEDFDKVQSLLSRDTRTTPKMQKLSLFAGFLKCPDCGRAMQKRTVKQRSKIYQYYACGTYRKMHSGACTKHMIRHDILEDAVLTTLNKYIQLAVDFDKLIENINKKSNVDKKSQRLQNQKAEKQKEIAEAQKVLLDLYPDFKSGLLSREQYLALKEKYENCIFKAKNLITEIEEKIFKLEDGVESNEFVLTFIKYHGLKELTRDVLIELVDNIYIHEGGAVEIHLKCEDAFEDAAEYISQNKLLL